MIDARAGIPVDALLIPSMEGVMTNIWKVQSFSLATTAGVFLHLVRHFRCAVSALRAYCGSLAP